MFIKKQTPKIVNGVASPICDGHKLNIRSDIHKSILWAFSKTHYELIEKNAICRRVVKSAFIKKYTE